MNDRSFYTITLGCKLNQFDSAAIEGELLRRGFSPLPSACGATVVVINTCTVTHKADAEARKLIRSVRRENPDCRLLVTGCYVESDAEAIRAIAGVDMIFGNAEKSRMGAILDELGLGAEGCMADEPSAALHFGRKSRALLKIQQGCRLACSYCIVPRVRGPSISVPPEEIIESAGSLFRAGFREIVLTGINTGDYGMDLEPQSDLAALLRRLLSICGPNRIRLNSLEPLAISEGIVELMAADSRLAPHLQVPLQSGSEEILRLMRRNYRLEQYLDKLQQLRSRIPHIGLGADVIVGFPGETDAQFQQTYDFIAGSPLNFLHVFAWSPRRGTVAAELPGRIAGPVIHERSAILRGLADQLSLRFKKSFEGKLLDAVVLAETRALTGNYIEVRLHEGSAVRGELVGVIIHHATPEETTAMVVEAPSWARPQPRSDSSAPWR
jgi:threonylcarbamoyladenosine tRNA methylthiotransferase MtaB